MSSQVDLRYEDLSYRVRGCVFEVYRRLGAGFLERVYERALMMELGLNGVAARTRVGLPVYYRERKVGCFFPDIIVENKILIELKAQPSVPPSADAQIINYLKASGLGVGFLVNFTHPKASIRRFVR